MAFTAGTVTIDKAYFETLMRRAQFHTSGEDFTTPAQLATVTIPKTDHDSLLSATRQYANLRRNLYQGGISEETLAVLIKDDNTNENGNSCTRNTSESATNASSFLSPFHTQPTQGGGEAWPGAGRQDYTYGRNANYTPRNGESKPRDNNGFNGQSQIDDDFSFGPDEPADSIFAEGNGDFRNRSTRQQYQKFAKRTILLVNLPERTTHAEVVDVIRGGMLLDIFLRSHDRAASVSFLEAAHAQEFFRHVKRHDLYIRGKRIEIRWNDRMFILPGHVANKVAIGATRNLVIHNRSPNHTEEAIRDDLEHIHNLVVIKISIGGESVYISTNSVHNAMFARTCMMSRASYKGSRIEWDDDECAAPLIKPQQPRQDITASKKKKDEPLLNRFQLLEMDGAEDDSFDNENDASGHEYHTPESPTLIAR